MTRAYAPGDLVTLPIINPWERVGIVVEIHDFGPGEPVYYDVKTPGRAPWPMTADEIHAATDEEKAAHHYTWLRALTEEWEWRRSQEPHCESQGCHCSPSLPCDEGLCDGQQHDDGSTVSCTMCVRERVEMTEQSGS